jgi:hypothetical protein
MVKIFDWWRIWMWRCTCTRWLHGMCESWLSFKTDAKLKFPNCVHTWGKQPQHRNTLWETWNLKADRAKNLEHWVLTR